VVRVVGLENVMMHEGMPFKGITEKFHQKGAVHDVPVQRPFEQGTENCSGNNANGTPKKKHGHKKTFNFLFKRLKENFQPAPNAA
jgi:hypothetical protein